MPGYEGFLRVLSAHEILTTPGGWVALKRIDLPDRESLVEALTVAQTFS
jgi:hypothetical protein